MKINKQSTFGTSNPVALITGSGKTGRVGRVIAERMAEDGYRIVLHANKSVEDARDAVTQWCEDGIDATVLTADFQDEKSPGELVRAAHAWQGRLDVLVNAAAVWDPRPFAEVTADDLQWHWKINTLATFLCCQAAGLLMAEQTHGGAIINMGDWATVRPYLDYSAYFPSKAALGAMTSDLAVELAQLNPGIRVNAVLPGTVTLPATMPEQDRQDAINETLLRKEGTPDHIAHAVISLVENDYVTGVCLPVDAGRTIHVAGEAEWRRK